MSSPFSEILAEVVGALPGSSGAVFVDWEGEAVDEFSTVDSHELRLLAAHGAIAYYQARNVFFNQGLGQPEEVALRFKQQQVLIRRVTDDYLVVLSVGHEVNLARALQLLREAEPRLRGAM